MLTLHLLDIKYGFKRENPQIILSNIPLQNKISKTFLIYANSAL